MSHHPAFCRFAAVLVFGSASLLTGCAPGGGLRPVPSYDPSQYRLGVDDEIRVVTYQQDQLTSDYRVASDGKIAVPMLGELQAAGMTTDEFAHEMEGALTSAKMLRTPNVTVQVTAYRLVSILGEVAKPGQYPYQPAMTMLTAISAAGGFTYRAVESYGYVLRQEGDHTVVGRIRPQDYVKPGDVIKIYERHF